MYVVVTSFWLPTCPHVLFTLTFVLESTQLDHIRKGHHMNRKTSLAAATVLAAALSLAACRNDDDAEANDATTPATAQEQDVADSKSDDQEQPASDIDAAVQTFITALDDLGVDHTDPERSDVGLSGAKATFDLDINGGDSGINVYPNPEALSSWQEASDSFGGIHVQLSDIDAVLSMNTDEENIAETAELAPQIADKVGGTAHGV